MGHVVTLILQIPGHPKVCNLQSPQEDQETCHRCSQNMDQWNEVLHGLLKISNPFWISVELLAKPSHVAINCKAARNMVTYTIWQNCLTKQIVDQIMAYNIVSTFPATGNTPCRFHPQTTAHSWLQGLCGQSLSPQGKSCLRQSVGSSSAGYGAGPRHHFNREWVYRE